MCMHCDAFGAQCQHIDALVALQVSIDTLHRSIRLWQNMNKTVVWRSHVSHTISTESMPYTLVPLLIIDIKMANAIHTYFHEFIIRMIRAKRKFHNENAIQNWLEMLSTTPTTPRYFDYFANVGCACVRCTVRVFDALSSPDWECTGLWFVFVWRSNSFTDYL